MSTIYPDGDIMAAIKSIKYLIIGNSAGGIGAAEAIRELDDAGTVAIVSDEPYPAYSRPLISEYLAHPYPVEKMLYRQTDFYEKNRIQTIFGEKAVKIDPAARTVTLQSGRELSWQKLLLATQSWSRLGLLLERKMRWFWSTKISSCLAAGMTPIPPEAGSQSWMANTQGKA